MYFDRWSKYGSNTGRNARIKHRLTPARTKPLYTHTNRHNITVIIIIMIIAMAMISIVWLMIG